MIAPTDAHLATHYLTLLLGDDLYAIALGTVKDIRGPATPRPLEAVPAYVAGAIDHALGALPLVDLRRRIGLPPRQGVRPPVTVVIERAGVRYAVVADAVAEVVDLGVPDQPPATATPDAGPDARADLAWLRGAAAAGDRMVLMLDPDQLLAPADRPAVAIALDSAGTAAAA